MLYRYSRWDGTQEVDPFSAEQLMDSVADDLMENGDLDSALRRMFKWGAEGPNDQRLPGLQDLLDRLRDRRKQELGRYNLDSMMDDIRQRLEEVVETERQGIQKRLDQAGQQEQEGGQPPSDALRQMLEKVANQRLQALDQLPPDPAGQIKELRDYDFMDQDARRKFDELMKILEQQILGNQFEGLKQSLQSLTPQDLQGMREMVKDLNQLLQEKLQGGNPDFQGFMDKHGQYFPPGIQSLEQLVEHMQRRAAQAQSLLKSMSPEMRQGLQGIMDGLLRDDRLRWDLARMAAAMEQMMPRGRFQGRYPFDGDESLTMREAMGLMDRLQQMDDLERELRRAQNPEDLRNVDPQRMADLLGPEAAEQLEQMRQITQMLEEAGFVEKRGDRYELTARAIRHIGQKALRDIFGRLKKDAFGKHETEHRGTGGERTEETKPYEFGDPFLVNLEDTLMNSLVREGAGTPLRLKPTDFSVYRTEQMTESAIVLMVDMSRSMLLNGCFGAAKKVALALNSLIKSQYPNDKLYIVLFSQYAREVKPETLPELTWDEEEFGTNMHHALMLARKLLGRHKMGNRQIIVITDGEPTAHLEDDRALFSYPPTHRTIVETLKEVDRCTRDRIVVNTFMLERSRSLVEFVNQMTKINRGRAFFCTPDRLGEYVLVDYVASKRKKVA